MRGLLSFSTIFAAQVRINSFLKDSKREFRPLHFKRQAYKLIKIRDEKKSSIFVKYIPICEKPCRVSDSLLSLKVLPI